jgi:hypothetical protein
MRPQAEHVGKQRPVGVPERSFLELPAELRHVWLDGGQLEQ